MKTDRIDAHTLAHLLRTGYLPEAYAAPQRFHELRHRTRHRARLVWDRTRHTSSRCSCGKNRVQGVLLRYNLQSPASDLFGRKGRSFLGELLSSPTSPLPESARYSVDDHLRFIDFYDERIAGLEAKLATLAKDDPAIPLLRTLPGVGLIRALTIRAELGEVERFQHSKQVVRWAGLSPKVRASDQVVQYGHISH